MFSKSVAVAAQYTRPVVASKRLLNGEVESGIATYIVINDAGWVLTAAHVLQGFVQLQTSQKAIRLHEKNVAAINGNPAFSSGKKKHEIKQLKADPSWITNHSLWWSVDGIGCGPVHFDFTADIAFTQLTGPLEKLNVRGYPTFANPANSLLQGTSLCRLEFPFHEIKATFNDNLKAFSIQNMPQLAMFPNDGILTRNLVSQSPPPNQRQIRFLETSSAGLRGQSGGPIFDASGVVWALQSRTEHLPLGFNPVIKFNGKEIMEHQFMHCGLGIHVSHLRDKMEELKIAYHSA